MSSNDDDDVYEQCLVDVDGADVYEMVRCVARALQKHQSEERVDDRLLQEETALEFASSFLFVIFATMVFFMQGGFAMLCAGCVRHKNVSNTMLKNLLDACGAALAFFTVGYAFAYGGTSLDSTSKTFIGNSNFFLMNVEDFAFWLFQYAFSAAAVTIVAGTLAERCKMSAYLYYSILLSGFVYPVIVRAFWSTEGFLSPNANEPLWGTGVIDFAGSGVVHTTGGITAILATSVLGPRKGRFHDDEGRRLEVPKEIKGHSVALQILGTFVLWFGWYGFNVGSALTMINSQNQGAVGALAGVNTALSGGMGGVSALFVNLIIMERHTGEPIFDLKYAMNGALSGLVAVTGGCGVVEPWAAVLIGFVAGNLYIFGTWGLVKIRLDDAVDAIPVHLLNGLWGLIAVGFLASPSRLEDAYGRSKHVGWCYSWGRGSGDATLLGAQLVGALFILAWVSVIMFPFFFFLNWKGMFRSDALEELVGLDTSYHGGLALQGEGINPEYISAFKKQRDERAERRMSRRSNDKSSEFEVGL